MLVSTLVGAEVRLSSELGASVSVERLIVGLILVSSADGLLLGPGIGENYNKQEFKYEQYRQKQMIEHSFVNFFLPYKYKMVCQSEVAVMWIQED